MQHESIPIAEAWSIMDIAAAAEVTMAARTEAARPLDAEIVPESDADWYLVQTYPGDDGRAMRWLARRRFGVFRPMQQRVQRKDGVKVQGWEPMFPGWLFVFCWDIRKMRTRILSAPGVAGIFCDPVTEAPIPIDQPEVVKDKDGAAACTWPRLGFVEKLRSFSWVYDEAAPNAAALRSNAGVRAERHIKRSVYKLGAKERRTLQRLKQEAKRMDLFDDDEWDEIRMLDPGLRIARLKQRVASASDAGGRAHAQVVNPPECRG